MGQAPWSSDYGWRPLIAKDHKEILHIIFAIFLKIISTNYQDICIFLVIDDMFYWLFCKQLGFKLSCQEPISHELPLMELCNKCLFQLANIKVQILRASCHNFRLLCILLALLLNWHKATSRNVSKFRLRKLKSVPAQVQGLN